ncbi:uncharacterized protein LOC121873670 isoform X2 [Homarus americanus]|uniref:Putative ABC transporter, phosphonate, periplasmic substrate-binding protein domain-containing protein n=1 Tax=Homarus americanus TaxID=6706 RepID=A0A8J5MTB5_HOMAM|nr:uncharacterized protein LOC121873670 isoform X2 [Homarus americanus]KAG7162651.1 putative ABC transporter, phosphonate, periplasmic substrate-binding protein domain-containing protein [Homarus americanus]
MTITEPTPLHYCYTTCSRFNMENKPTTLRLATYMCPGVPVEYFEFLAEYLETQLNLETILLYNSRRRGPDISREGDLHIDIAFVSTSSYLENFKSSPSSFQLLPVGAVTKHPKKGNVLGYYTDILVHRDVKERVKEFLDARGCKFVYSHEGSLSSSKLVLRTLKQMGEDASFFSDIQASGNHMNSIETVVAKKAEMSAVDSLSLANYLTCHYYQEPELHLQESWGPLPPHPILINNKFPVDLRNKIEEALLSMHKFPKWMKQLNTFSITGFRKTSFDNYLEAADLLDATKNLSYGITYY